MKVKYLILGAGPAGLTLANRLRSKGEDSFLVLEQETVAGGLCRSVLVDGSELDIGGGHFLDVRRPEVVDFLFGFMPESEWNVFERDSRIYVHDSFIGHPFEANIWQFPAVIRQKYLDSIQMAGCNRNEPKPEKFTDWITWKLGTEIAGNYMIPYNKKLFGDALDELGTYWLEKLPNVSYEETLQSCKEHRAYGTQPGHARFYYPKKTGFGEVFRRMADALGDHMVYGEKITHLDCDKRIVNHKYEADCIINTVPWTGIDVIEGLSDAAMSRINSLKYTGVSIDYYPESMDIPAQWIYYPMEELVYHRILVRHNFLLGSKGYWTETNLDRRRKNPMDSLKGFENEYAYPLNTIGKNEAMADLLRETEAKSVIGLGRWGEWQHYNTDVVIERAMRLSERI